MNSSRDISKGIDVKFSRGTFREKRGTVRSHLLVSLIYCEQPRLGKGEKFICNFNGRLFVPTSTVEALAGGCNGAVLLRRTEERGPRSGTASIRLVPSRLDSAPFRSVSVPVSAGSPRATLRRCRNCLVTTNNTPRLT